MKVSVIIPTWNRAELISRAIESVVAQTFPPHELIVVDDGSTDDTATLIRQQYPEIRLLEQPNGGVSAARNAGIKAATGDWIALLDSDDEWLPEKLTRQMLSAEKNPDIRLIHCDEIWIRNGVRVNPKHKHQKNGGWIYQHCLPLCAISPSAAVLRRDVFNTVGYFDESLPACEDYDYWLRFCAHEPVLFIDELLLNKFGGHADQLSHKHWGMDRFRMQALAKAINSGKLNNTALQQTQDQLQEKLRIFSLGATKHNNQELAQSLAVLYQPLLSL